MLGDEVLLVIIVHPLLFALSHIPLYRTPYTGTNSESDSQLKTDLLPPPKNERLFFNAKQQLWICLPNHGTLNFLKSPQPLFTLQLMHT